MQPREWISIYMGTLSLIAVWFGLLPAAITAEPREVLLCGTPFVEMLARPTCSGSLATTDIVVFAKLTRIEPQRSKSLLRYGSFEIVEVLKGAQFPALRIGGRLDNLMLLEASRVGDIYHLASTAPPDWNWRGPWKLDDGEREYYREVLKLPPGPERYAFFFEHLEEKGLRGDDARNEFHKVSYRTLLELRPHLPQEKIIERLKSKQLHERALTLLLLGICGNEDDAAWMARELKQIDAQHWRERTALLIGYLSLTGEKGLPLIEEKYLSNPAISKNDLQSALHALRFVAAETDAIPRARLATIFRGLLNREDCAQYALIGLAHCGDWSQLTLLEKRFEQAEREPHRNGWPFVIIQYLRICPLDEALPLRQECEEQDPVAAHLATVWFGAIDAHNLRPVWEQELLFR